MIWTTLRKHRTFHKTGTNALDTQEKGYSEAGVLFLYQFLKESSRKQVT